MARPGSERTELQAADEWMMDEHSYVYVCYRYVSIARYMYVRHDFTPYFRLGGGRCLPLAYHFWLLSQMSEYARKLEASRRIQRLLITTHRGSKA